MPASVPASNQVWESAGPGHLRAGLGRARGQVAPHAARVGLRADGQAGLHRRVPLWGAIPGFVRAEALQCLNLGLKEVPPIAPMHDLDDGGLPRPRASSWGTSADRALLQAIAEDLTRRAGYTVCAIEVLRSDNMLEFAAIAGSPEGSERLMGQGSPLESMEIVFDKGWNCHGWTFVAGKELDQHTQDVLAEYGHLPDYVPDSRPDAWQPEDMLFTRLTGVRGELRALLYFDEPATGRRPTVDDLERLDQEVRLMLDSVVGIVERESFGEQMRMIETFRAAIRPQRRRADVAEIIAMVHTELPAGFRASRVGVTLLEDVPAGWEDYVPLMTEIMTRVWRNNSEVILDPDEVWGDDALEPYADVVREMLGAYGIHSSVMIPFGIGDELVGVLSMARRVGQPRWTDSEIMGGHQVAVDIAAAVADARLMEREMRLNSELRALDDYRRRLLNTVAHELQNPVGVLVGHLDLLSMVDLPAETDRSTAAMERATGRISAMAQNLVALGKVTDPDRPVPTTPVDLSALVHDVLDLSDVLAQGAGVSLTGDVEAGLVVAGDTEELRRVVNNVVGNALKYSHRDGTVGVSLSRTEEGVLFVCTDDGMGIPSDDLDRLFTAFFRSSNPAARAKPGTGLGLAIAAQVVERHGGRIDVESVLGDGTTFRVVLPAG